MINARFHVHHIHPAAFQLHRGAVDTDAFAGLVFAPLDNPLLAPVKFLECTTKEAPLRRAKLYR